MTLHQLSRRPLSVPVATTRLLAGLGESKGRAGHARLTDRDEQEIRGYREALTWIHENHAAIPISVEAILRLHYLSHGQTGDAGQFKTRDSDIIEKYPDGRIRVRFEAAMGACAGCCCCSCHTRVREEGRPD